MQQQRKQGCGIRRATTFENRSKARALESQRRSSLLEDKFGVEWRVDVAKSRAWVDFIQVLDALVHVVLDGRECGHYCGGAEAMGDHGEVGERALDAWVEDRLRSRVAQGRPVLVQQVHQLLADKPIKRNM